MVDEAREKLAKAQVIMAELKDAGYSNKDLRELSLLVLLEMGCRVENPQVDGYSI